MRKTSKVTLPVDPTDPEVADLIEDLFETMYDAKGRGLAAPQIGVMKQVFVVDIAWKEAAPEPIAFINPLITSGSDDTEVADEQCLSLALGSQKKRRGRESAKCEHYETTCCFREAFM